MFGFLRKNVLEKKSKTLAWGMAFILGSFVFSGLSFGLNNSNVSAYSATLTTASNISIDVIPSSDGSTTTKVDAENLNVVTDCRAGYNLTINGPSDRNLYKDGSSTNNATSQYFTPVDGTSTLINSTNKWGYSLSASTASGVFTPLLNTITYIRTASQTASQTDIDDDIPIYYGVAADKSINPGIYQMSNNAPIVYQLTMDDSCQAFTVSFNANGGTGTMTPQDIVAGTPTKLTKNTFIAPNKGQSYQDADGNTIPADPNKMWTFWGWNTEVDGTGDWYKDLEQVTDLTSSGNTIILYAQWKQATLTDLIPAPTPSPSDPKTIDHNTMQDMSAATCWNSDITTKAALVAAGKTGAATLTDNRDGTTRSYDVSKLADGMCWMTTNLALGTTTDITLTADDTDLAPNTTFTLPAGDTTSYTATTNLAKVRLTNTSSATTNGAYYTWNAATANTTSTSTTPTTSICPRNWDLPTNAQYTALSSASAYSSSNPTTDLPSQFKIDGGFTNGASFSQTSYSYFWTADSSSNTIAYNRRVNSTSLYSSNSTTESYGGGYKYYRKNIRCVANAGSANIIYHSNNTASATSAQAINIATGSLASSSLFTPETHKQFKEWNTRPDGTGTSYAAGAAASSVGLYPDQSLDLYAIWNEVYYIAFNANGGTGTMTNQTVARNTATAISTNTFTYTGQIFRGWNTSPDGTGTLYSDGQKVTNLTTTGNTITLYAIWVNGALLDTGTNVNLKLKRLAGNSSATYSTQDNTITAIVRSNSLPNNFTPATENTISDSSSPLPIYAWYDSTNTTIYYYSEATNIMMNRDSSSFFYQMRALSDLSTISTWDTIKVTNMSNMFYYAGYNAASFTLDLSSWNTASVTNMYSMFSSAGHDATTWSIGDLSDWKTSNVTNMQSMFSNAGFNTTTFDIGDLSDWNTSNVTNMSGMFSTAGYNATTWSVGNLSSWDTSSVKAMYSMFSSAGYSATTWSIGDLSSWNTSSVTNMASMFSQAGFNTTTFDIGDLSSWNTSKVANMSNMFFSAGSSATIWSIGDLSSWNTSSATTMSHMFYSAGSSATTWSIGNLSSWDTSSVTAMYSMFGAAGYSATTFDIGNLSSWDTSKVTSMSGMFNNAGRNATTWSIGDLSSWNTSIVTDMNNMFANAGYSAITFDIGDLSSWNTSSVTDMSYMFNYAGFNTTTFDIGDLSSWNTSSVTDMSYMFSHAGYSATTFTLDLSSWNTSSVTDMSSMFNNAGRSATTWSVTIPKTNDGTASGPITNTTSNLYGKTTSVTATPPSGKSFTLAN